MLEPRAADVAGSAGFFRTMRIARRAGAGPKLSKTGQGIIAFSTLLSCTEHDKAAERGWDKVEDK